jgi:hypothetical protein
MSAKGHGAASIHIKPSHKGLLHKRLGVKKGSKIPVAALEKAAHSSSETAREQAQFALNSRKWRH